MLSLTHLFKEIFKHAQIIVTLCLSVFSASAKDFLSLRNLERVEILSLIVLITVKFRKEVASQERAL